MSSRICHLLLFTGVLMCAIVPLHAASSDDYQAQLSQTDLQSTDARYALAVWCDAQDMHNEAIQHYEAVIDLDADHAGARAALGYEQVDGKWLRGIDLKEAQGWVRYRGKWLSPEDQAKKDKGYKYDRKSESWVEPSVYYEGRGYVKYLGRWVSKNRKKMLEQQHARLQAEAAKRADWDNAWELKTRNFRIKSNCPHQIVQEMAESLELAIPPLCQVFGIPKLNGQIPLEIYATQEQFMEYSAKAGFPMHPGVLGYYYYGGNGKGIRMFYPGSIEQALSTAFHECTHFVSNQASGFYRPKWSEEGLAVLFEDAKREGDRIDIEAIPFRRLWGLRRQMENNDIDLNHLVSIKGDFPGQYYSQGWSMIYFFLTADNGRYSRAFTQYLKLVRQHQEPNQDNIELFKMAFRKEPNAYLDEWEAFVASIQPESAEEYADAAIASLGGWLKWDEAKTYADKALELDDELPQGFLAQGLYYLRRALYSDDLEEQTEFAQQAIDYYQRYSETDAGNLENRRFKGSKLLRNKHYCNYATAHCLAGNYDEATALIDAVLQIDPLSSEAFRTMAYLHATADDPEFASVEAAKSNLEMANNFGENHRSKWVAALIAIAEDDKQQAGDLLQQAQREDYLGFGAHFYRFEHKRLTKPEKPKNQKNNGKKQGSESSSSFGF